ncbi:MAG: HAD family hydrolase [Armatimonadota bacterium]
MKTKCIPRQTVKAVIFDIGATLVTGPAVAPNKVIARLISNTTPSEIASMIMTRPLHSADEVISVLQANFGVMDDKVAKAVRELWESQANAARETNGATETVMALKRRGFKVGLVSDIWTPYYLSVIKAIPDILHAADSVVLSFQTGQRKPALFNFSKALEELQVEPPEAIMIGDTYEHDILPALEMGMLTVWVLARPEREKDFIIRVLNNELPAPQATVADIRDVSKLSLLLEESPVTKKRFLG